MMEDPLGAYRSELRAHCYRLLGSAHDAEDALQEVSVRAWRGRAGFEGRSSLRTWLHRITVNVCLNVLERKERRVLPVDVGRASGPDDPFDLPVGEPLWLEPLPADPLLAAVERETVELGFVAALQHLPANQRAVLVMFDVLGFSADEVAEALETTSASVNSALQRARKQLELRRPAISQQATLQALGDTAQRELVLRYTTALRDRDVDTLVGLLVEDATWSMPPLANWYQGRDAIAGFLADGPFVQRWQHRSTTANGQLAVGCFMWDDTTGGFGAYALDVLEISGASIGSIVSFIGGDRFPAFGLPSSLPEPT